MDHHHMKGYTALITKEMQLTKTGCHKSLIRMEKNVVTHLDSDGNSHSHLAINQYNYYGGQKHKCIYNMWSINSPSGNLPTRHILLLLFNPVSHDWHFWDCSPPARHLCPWDFPSKNTIVDCHFLLQKTYLHMYKI